ncbi:MAG TPA: hypothetical protein VHL58_10190 [Thermoanaerobaculia bacterium]|nr:hypothetical protein [Thermoanaerobaculia bacterium]
MSDDELKRLLEANAAETRGHFDRLESRFSGLEKKVDAFSGLEKKVDASVASVAELHRHFDVITESVKHEIQVVAEAVAQLDEKVGRENEDIREELRRGFAETQAMIKFSHAELDRRVRTLEQGLSDLLARVERLEATIH